MTDGLKWNRELENGYDLSYKKYHPYFQKLIWDYAKRTKGRQLTLYYLLPMILLSSSD